METYFLPIVLAILGSGGVTALVTWLISRKKQPLEELSAKTDAASVLVASSLAIVTKLEERVKSLEDTEVANEARIEKMELDSRTQANLINRLTARIELWVTWAEELRINWAFVRLDEEPPQPPDMCMEDETLGGA